MNVVYDDDDVGENLPLLVINRGKSPRHQFRVKTIRFTGRPGNKLWYDDHLGVGVWRWWSPGDRGTVLSRIELAFIWRQRRAVGVGVWDAAGHGGAHHVHHAGGYGWAWAWWAGGVVRWRSEGYCPAIANSPGSIEDRFFFWSPSVPPSRKSVRIFLRTDHVALEPAAVSGKGQCGLNRENASDS